MNRIRTELLIIFALVSSNIKAFYNEWEAQFAFDRLELNAKIVLRYYLAGIEPGTIRRCYKETNTWDALPEIFDMDQLMRRYRGPVEDAVASAVLYTVALCTAPEHCVKGIIIELVDKCIYSLFRKKPKSLEERGILCRKVESFVSEFAIRGVYYYSPKLRTETESH